MHLRRFCLCLLLLIGAPLHAKDLAEDGLASRIETIGPNATFELGMLQTLRAAERVLQARYDYGLTIGSMSAPLLRLEIQQTPDGQTKQATPSTFTDVTRGFVEDLREAQQTLAASDEDVRPFDLALNDIWFDVNSNSAREPGEGAMEMLGPVILGPWAWQRFEATEVQETPFVVRFDSADHAWLWAYTHMLSGLGNLVLAFDPTPVIADMAQGRERLQNAPEIPNIYDTPEMRSELERVRADQEEVKQSEDTVMATLRPLLVKQRQLRIEATEAEESEARATAKAALEVVDADVQRLRDEARDLSRQRIALRTQIEAIQAKLAPRPDPLSGWVESERATIDILYLTFAALEQSPDPSRVRDAHEDWRAMIRLNRTFWKKVEQETDNEREWIPNRRQVSVLPFDMPDGVEAAWQAILSDAEDMLNGDLLVPHPLLPAGHGISLPAYVDDPAPLNLLTWLHGRAAWDYAAKGPLMSAQSWRNFQRLTSGNAGSFALFFN